MNAKARRTFFFALPWLMLVPLVSNSCSSEPQARGQAAGSVERGANAPVPAAPVEVAAADVGTDLEMVGSGVRVRFSPRIDRIVFFGPEGGGPNLLHAVDLSRSLPANGDYTFFGGAYSWWAPQNGEKGWVGADGTPKNWPPDPAMDVGPAVLTAKTDRSITVVGPVQRSGLRESKTIRIKGPNRAEISYTLTNTTNRTMTAGPWLNTAVTPGAGSVMAFRTSPGGMRGNAEERSSTWSVRGAMGENADALFRGALTGTQENGWNALPLSNAMWKEGIKVYLEAWATSSEPAELAVWRDGWWLHRRLTTGDRDSHERMRQFGEGPVATYINPGLGIIEAELVAPIVDIPPGGETTAVEVWTLIPSATADVNALPR
ncbi:MAG: hypothetical protein ACKVZJ_05040 [Phycisphaerales bacterium]